MRTSKAVQRLRDLVAEEGAASAAKVAWEYVRWRSHGRPFEYDEYAEWIEAVEAIRPSRIDSNAGFSVVMPVYNTDPAYLSEAVESVVTQTHRKWELVMVDDASTRGSTSRAAAALSASDPRISLITLESNGGIAVATNAGIDQAKYEWIAFMDHDDRIHRDALAWFSGCAVSSDLIYSDEDKLDEAGRRHNPTLKPAWSSRLLLSNNYVNHLAAVRTSIVRDLGGLRAGFDGAQDHDLMLRVSEIPGLRVTHVPNVLYHWRIFSRSFSNLTESSRSSEESGLRAVGDAIGRRGWSADSSLGTGSWFNYRPRFRELSPRPSVKAVVPTRDHVGMLRKCVSSVLARSDGVDLHLVVVDNGSAKAKTIAYLAELEARDDVTVIHIDDEFNYSDLCNQGAEAGPKTDYLLMLNNDVEVQGRNWLKQMTGWLDADPAACAVGTKLLFRDGTIQHAGVVLGLRGVAGHYAEDQDNAPQANNLHDQAREVTAVTGAALLVRSEDFFAVGGFRTELPLVYQDTDLCMRLSHDTGGSIIYDPTYPLVHRGSASRAKFSPEQAYGVARFQFLWSEELIAGDDFYSPHLDLTETDFVLRALPTDVSTFAPRFNPRSRSNPD